MTIQTLFTHPDFSSDSFSQAGAKKSANEKGSDAIFLHSLFSILLCVKVTDFHFGNKWKSNARQWRETHFISVCFKLTLTFHFNKTLIWQKYQSLNSSYECLLWWQNYMQVICRKCQRNILWMISIIMLLKSIIAASSEAVCQSSHSASFFLTVT